MNPKALMDTSDTERISRDEMGTRAPWKHVWEGYVNISRGITHPALARLSVQVRIHQMGFQAACEMP